MATATLREIAAAQDSILKSIAPFLKHLGEAHPELNKCLECHSTVTRALLIAQENNLDAP